MPVLVKLMEARRILHAQKLKKTGHNKFAGYFYFELGDFIVPALEIFNSVGLAGYISYSHDIASLRIVDIEDNSDVVITAPMSTAALKGAHEVQNLGAVLTYLRRYLWVTALEIVEHDAIDATTGKGVKKTITPTDGAIGNLPTDLAIAAKDDAGAIVLAFSEDRVQDAFNAYLTLLEGDPEYMVAVWAFLQGESSIRSTLKRMKAVHEKDAGTV